MDLTIAGTTHVLGHLVLLLPFAFVLLLSCLHRSPRRTTLRLRPTDPTSSCEPRPQTSTLKTDSADRLALVGLGEGV
ncbi:hypothetical protein BD310DRAFT_921009, partial [Dichomitus squalens]